jgi:excisionase family DNA binding protein
MAHGKPNLLSTGQAARLCSVTPDTVLKWIKRGRLNASRTAGGHYRIDLRDLDPFVVTPHEEPPRELPAIRDAEDAAEVPKEARCWEYLSTEGKVREDCRQCVVYRVRATRCFLIAGLEQDVGHARQFCHGSCEECVYFRRVQGLGTNVLCISSDGDLRRRLDCTDDTRVTVQFAKNAYEASAIIQDFRPAFVVIDVERVQSWDTDLLDSLAEDPRLPGLRIILIVSPGMSSWRRQQLEGGPVVSVLEKPLACTEILRVITGSLEESRLLEGRAS